MDGPQVLRLSSLCRGPGLPGQAMFYLLQREKELNLHPRFFGPKLLDTLTAQLRSEVG